MTGYDSQGGLSFCCQTDQGNVVLVRVCVAEGAVVDDQGPGKGYQAAGDRDSQEGHLGVGVKIQIE